MTTKRIGFLILIAMMLWPAAAGATPPKKLALDYDTATQTLSVTIEHPTLIRWFHHIKTVEIKVNGNPYETKLYDTQPGDTFTYTYKVPAAPGDKLEVTARCNLYGTRTAVITAAKPGSP